MGLYLTLVRVPADRLSHIVDDPHAWYDLEVEIEGLWSEEHGRVSTEALGTAALHKTWDALRFLLDPALRAGSSSDDFGPTTLSSAAVWGAHAVSESFLEALDENGFTMFDRPPRYNTATEVPEIVSALENVSIDRLLDVHARALEAAQSYAYGGRPLQDADRASLQSGFEVARRLYAEAKRREQAVAVLLR